MALNSVSVAAARNLTTVTKSLPQMTDVSPRWLLRLLPWVPVTSGTYRVNRRKVLLKDEERIDVAVEDGAARVSGAGLAKMHVLSHLQPSQLTWVAERFESSRVEAGTVIMREGDPGDRFCILARGTAEVTMQSEYGTPVRIGLLSTGEYFGETALLRESTRTATVRAVTPCIVASLPREDFMTLLAQAPELGEHLQEASDRMTALRARVTEYGEARSAVTTGYESTISESFVDYEEKPREYPMSVIQTVLGVHTRITDLYNDPISQLAQQLRLTLESMREQQEFELFNNREIGLLHNADPSMRIRSRSGPPTPDDMDELLSRVWKEPSFFLAHPRAIAAFGRECTRRGVPPPTEEMFGRPMLTWRGVPIIPSDKLLVNGRRRPSKSSGRTSVLLVRAGADNGGIIGLAQAGLDCEHVAGLSVRLMGINAQAVAAYLVSLYYSLAVQTEDALGVLEDVEVGNYYEYSR